LASWAFLSIDPATGVWPENPVAGFLFVNDETKRGEGSVSYTIRPRPGLPTGAELRGVANIVFDTNLPVATNQIDPADPSKGTDPNREALVTLDAAGPASQVDPLPAISSIATFTVTWMGNDDAGGPTGSGIASFDVFVSDNGGPFELWLDDTASHSGEFPGQDGHTYRFYSVATDNVGFVEAAPTTHDAETTVELPLEVSLLVTGADAGGGPHVRAFQFDGTLAADFFAFTPGFLGGVRVAAGDFDGDRRADIITAAGPGGGPHVRVFGADAELLSLQRWLHRGRSGGRQRGAARGHAGGGVGRWRPGSRAGQRGFPTRPRRSCSLPKPVPGPWYFRLTRGQPTVRPTQWHCRVEPVLSGNECR
jgi:hypothetical protein